MSEGPPSPGEGKNGDPAACTLCELSTEGVDVTDEAGNRFCCTGCRDVYGALGDVDVDADAVRERRRERDGAAEDGEGSADGDRDVPDGHEATYLEVDGMHCATCEAFIETVATDADGVSGASASYVTDTVRIDRDPDAVTVDDLTETVSGLGYSAYARDDAFARRQASNMATARLAAGVLVGMAVMLQYIVLIYPTYFAFPFYNQRTLDYLNEAMASTSGTYFFIVIAVLTTIVLFFTGKPILRGAYVSAKTRSPNMDLLVAIAAVSAYLYSTLAVIFVESPSVYYDVTVAIIVIVTVGNHYEDSVKDRATELLSEVTAVQVDDARRLTADGDTKSVAVEALEPGDRLLVRAGERVPVDGEAVDGDAAVDESVVTGESLPVRKVAGDAVVGGSVVTDGSLTVAVGPDATSSLDRVAELVYDLQSGNHGVQKLADRLATVFVPAVLVIAAVAAGASLALGGAPTDAMLVGLTVLIVSCPCALGLATPLAVAAGIRDALERNIVVFDDTVFERIRDADTVVFDKTGTLTTGEMRLVARELDDDLLRLAAALESRSAHPVGQAIAAARSAAGAADAALGEAGEDGATPAVADGGVEPVDGETGEGGDAPAVESFESHARGVSGVVDGVEVVVGHPDLFDERGWTVSDEIREAVADARDVGRVPVAVGRDGAAEGYVVVGDELREGWEETVTALDESGVEVIVLTGDDERAATVFAKHDAVSSVFAGVPPEGKAEAVGRLKERGVTVMVGDGTNDAPALAAADLGIALGGGTAMAADAADVAIVDDDLGSVATVFELARAAGRRVRGNIGWAFCYNAVAIPLAATGLLNPLFAAVAMGASSLLVVTNSSRALLADD
ncbi:heavy metal translocating P-type ATPase [Halorubrum ruber]|uniref:Cation-translocating P-type ATPase n=1 Tax=Halorubrum ruber TaxID=2982524 RepID=A0A8T8LJN9_9EURY|nr:cation-translocating P-type ATPase [Halorubrum ruber]QUO47442.1 cation-translocating P-type ATPase [Halorubrum ruber]